MGPRDPQLSDLKGKAYVYKLNMDYQVAGAQRLLNMQLGSITNEINNGLGLHKHPLFLYPFAPHRMAGRVNPGEVER